MSVFHGTSTTELLFGGAALVMSLLAGLVLVPALRKAMSDPGDEKR